MLQKIFKRVKLIGHLIKRFVFKLPHGTSLMMTNQCCVVPLRRVIGHFTFTFMITRKRMNDVDGCDYMTQKHLIN